MDASVTTTLNTLEGMTIASDASELKDSCCVCRQTVFGHKDVFVASCQHSYHGWCLSRWRKHVDVAERRACLVCGAQTLPIRRVSASWFSGPSFYCEPQPLQACRNNDLPTVQRMLALDPGIACQQFPSAPVGQKTTLLHVAAEHGYEACIQVLLDSGADIDSSAPDQGVTPLYLAVGAGHLACVELLLRRGARVDDATKTGWTPIQNAAKRGAYHCLLALLDAGVDVNKGADNGEAVY